MRKFYVLNIEKGPEDPNNKTVIRDPKGQGGGDMWASSEALDLPEVRPGGPARKLKLCSYLLLK